MTCASTGNCYQYVNITTRGDKQQYANNDN